MTEPVKDVRGMISTGPFTMNPGDTQELVIAQIAAQGKDRLNSIALLKYYASIFQKDYPNFNISQAIDAKTHNTPKLTQNEFSAYDEIELNIIRNDSLENITENGYSFQGYNIYQLASESNFTSTGNKIYNFDIIDGTSSIYGETFDPSTGYLINDIIQNGSNSGIPKIAALDKDYITNSKFIKGKTYYYGISAYFYNEQLSKTIETELNLTSVIFQDDIEGPEYLDLIESNRISGTSDIKITTEIIDPTKLTGDTYEITFGEQHYYLDENSNWVKTNYPDSIGKALKKPNDQSPSKLIPLPSVYAPNNTLDLHLIVENNAPDSNYIDAISITFPEGIIINRANDIYSNHDAFPYIDQQTVTWG